MNPYQQQSFGNPVPINGLPNGGFQPQPVVGNMFQGYPQPSGYPNQGCLPTNQGFQHTAQGYSMPAQTGFPQATPGYPQASTGYLLATPVYPQATTGFHQPTPGYPQATTGFPQATLGCPQTHLIQGQPLSHHHGYSHKPKPKPTVVPANPFNPREDASVLRKAMKGLGTNEKAIINVVTKRTNEQRQKIAAEYMSVHGRDLITNLKNETSGRFEDLLVVLMTPLPQFYAKELHDAIAGIGTDEDVLIEVICTLSNKEMNAVKQAYNLAYKKSLESDFKGDTSGNFKKLLTLLCEGKRSEDYLVNHEKAKNDALKLHKAGKLRLGTDESVFNEILCTRSLPQLDAIFTEYGLLAGHDIDTAIKSEFSGEIEKALRAIVRIVRNQAAYFAERLMKSMKGLGTNDRQLIRIMATRCEIDLGDISELFRTKYGKGLQDWIKGDTSGNYRKCLIALLGD